MGQAPSGLSHQRPERGLLCLMTFSAPASPGLDRIFRITDGVMRSMIICKRMSKEALPC